CIECVPGGGRIHSTYRKGGDTLFRKIPLSYYATPRPQFQQHVLHAASQKAICRCIVASVAILNVGLKQFLSFSFVWRNPGHPAKQLSRKLSGRCRVEHKRDVIPLSE